VSVSKTEFYKYSPDPLNVQDTSPFLPFCASRPIFVFAVLLYKVVVILLSRVDVIAGNNLSTHQ